MKKGALSKNKKWKRGWRVNYKIWFGVKYKKWRRERRSNFKIGLGVKDKKWKKGEYPKFGWIKDGRRMWGALV